MTPNNDSALSAYTDATPIHTIETTEVFVIFFDGGSRGNPGAGGSGSVIVKADATTGITQPIWLASMAYGKRTTTNNLAEYQGLLHGLKCAKSGGLRPLHVVGDSQLIINQQESRRPPKAPHLMRLYQQCRVLADQCDVQTWTHHYRTYNKTADALANLAMDTKPSRQICIGPTSMPDGPWKEALKHAERDMGEWRTGFTHLAELSKRTGHP